MIIKKNKTVALTVDIDRNNIKHSRHFRRSMLGGVRKLANISTTYRSYF